MVTPSTFEMDRTPFVPKERDYGLESGIMWEDQTFYWIGGYFGWHLRNCWLLQGENCQQYLDFLGGSGGLDDDQASLLLLGLRWQWIRYPSSWSPFFRLMGGYMQSDINGRQRDRPVGVMGVGLTRHLNHRLDFRSEMRFGVGQKPFSQVVVGLQIKIDEWVSGFGKSLKRLGQEALGAEDQDGEK